MYVSELSYARYKWGLFNIDLDNARYLLSRCDFLLSPVPSHHIKSSKNSKSTNKNINFIMLSVVAAECVPMLILFSSVRTLWNLGNEL